MSDFVYTLIYFFPIYVLKTVSWFFWRYILLVKVGRGKVSKQHSNSSAVVNVLK